MAQEDQDTFGGESAFVTRPLRQPVRKISLPVRPMREQRREATRWDDSANFLQLKMSGRGEGSSINNGELASTTSTTFLHSWSKYKLCDDSLFYPGCCVEHDRLSLGEKSSASNPSESSGSRCSNISTNNYIFGDGAKSEANLHVTQDNVYFYNDCKTDSESLFSGNARACTDVTDSSYYTDSEIDDIFSLTDETVLNQNAGNTMKGKREEYGGSNDFESIHYDDESEAEDFQEDDLSLSTLSGSGMDFFRKFVRRKDQYCDDNRSSRTSTIKEDVNLIDRLICDTLLNKSESPTETFCSEDLSQELLGFQERQISPGSIGGCDSEVDVLNRSKESSVSGSGLFYLRNYLKKKSSNQNEEEDDDKADLSRSASRRSSSIASTLADLLNETFDSEDSELQKLDWDEFDEDPSEDLTDSFDVTEEDIGMSHHISPTKSFENEDLENEASTPILSESDPLNEDEFDEGVSKCGLSISIDSTDDDEDHFSSTCSTAKNSPSIQTLNPPDLLLSTSQGFKKLNLTGKEREDLIRSMKENEPVKKLILSSPTTFSLRKNSDASTTSEDAKDLAGPKNRLTDFWEKRVLHSNHNETTENNSDIPKSTSFRPAMPSYYNPETQSSASERIRVFLEATRKAAEESETSALTSTTTTPFSDSLLKRSPVTSATSSRI